MRVWRCNKRGIERVLGNVERRTRVRTSPPGEHRGVERGLLADRPRSKYSTQSNSTGMISSQAYLVRDETTKPLLRRSLLSLVVLLG